MAKFRDTIIRCAKVSKAESPVGTNCQIIYKGKTKKCRDYATGKKATCMDFVVLTPITHPGQYPRYRGKR